ncbi:MAG: NAD+ synthase [Proteobacteria bacterium]|nr:NAD+ synthase [Pseudomonadota bacterium]
MAKNWRVAIAQVNFTVGDLKGNCMRMIKFIERASELGVDIITFPELAITGYPPEDLLLKPKFIEDNLEALRELAKAVHDTVAIVGFVDRIDGDIYNGASIIYSGKIKGIYHKALLPNYGVFDEKRYFKPGNKPLVFRFGQLTFGVNICEDIWHSEGPASIQALSGAKLIFNINASPYHEGKIKLREEIVRSQARDNKVFILYANLVGGQDELVFDGQSMVVDANGEVIARALAFREDLLIVDLPDEALMSAGLKRSEGGVKQTNNMITIARERLHKKKVPISRGETRPLKPVAEVYEALVLGLCDYVTKNGFQKVVVGLSGGVDSSIVATLAVDALGKENVVGVFMPSRYTSQESEIDATKLAENLSISMLNIPVDGVYRAYLTAFEPFFGGLREDITEENIQARIRGNILMALSNKFGWLVLTTGNKSEMSVGYATLYGDMAGGFAVIKDVPKTLVYKLAIHRNTSNPVIPERVLIKEPTAELRPNQKDKDTLPPYDALDPILKAYIEEDKNLEEIVSFTQQKETVDKVLSMVDKSEYKRRQSPPGIKITPKAFGRDRRMPITNKYRG